MKTIGIDIGSSSIKAALLDIETGNCAASAQLPGNEMPIDALQSGWAEQDPDMWWNYAVEAVKTIIRQTGTKPEEVASIGISYQMHGLVCVDKDLKPLRKSIIWCDSRAVPYGNRAFDSLGHEKCLSHLLNSPGNFTASKLAWVKENEPALFEKIYKIMLPGDYIAARLTGEAVTTVTGLSEGIMWDFRESAPAGFLLDYYGIPYSFLADRVPHFGLQGRLKAGVAAQLGLSPSTTVTYRAGDQPNNAFSLNVLNPGEVAATAGTSGVVYGVTDQVKYDSQSRVNTFVHVNHLADQPRSGVLLCINGTGILNSWMRRNVAADMSYEDINRAAMTIQPGSEGVTIIPFGNGAERMLNNRETGAIISGLNLNIHNKAHVLRAVQEGIAFAFNYGMKIMENTGINLNIIRAGKANMFLSPVFRQTLATITKAEIQLYETDGALGAARGAAVGSGLYSSFEEAFSTLKVLETVHPEPANAAALENAYKTWNENLERFLD